MSKKRKVLVFGTFDVFHKGHEDFFRQAREFGDFLVVVVARDATVEKIKGRKPENDEVCRKEIVEKSKLADRVLLGNLGDKYKIIEEILPDVICLGYDQNSFNGRLESELEKRGLGGVLVAALEPFFPEIFKSSKMKKAGKG